MNENLFKYRQKPGKFRFFDVKCVFLGEPVMAISPGRIHSNTMKISEKTRYLLVNLARGFGWLIFLLALFVILKKNLGNKSIELLHLITDRTVLIYSIFIISELAFGIIPPELFMIWALQEGEPVRYVFIIAQFSSLSYLSGIAGYFFGWFLQTTLFFRFVRRKYLRKYEDRLAQFGSYLLIVASLTPVPYSGICMLVGSARFRFRKLVIYTLFRFLRFFLYAWFVWEANVIV